MVVLIDGGWLGAHGKTYPTPEMARASIAEAFRWEPPSPPKKPVAKDRRLKVFLCYAREDKAAVRDLDFRLRDSGLDPWFDERKILPGQLWKDETSKAIREVDSVLVCLSRVAVTKEGYVQKEIKEALDRSYEQPEGRIFIIPLRFEPCELPRKLSDRHCVGYFEPNGYELLIEAFRALAEWLNIAGHRISMPGTVLK